MLRTSVLSLLVCSAVLFAQGPSRAAGRGPRGNMPPPIVSCEVKADRTVTFRLNAPEATDVKVAGDFAQGPQQMTKGDDGIWSVSVGPLNPAIYSYTFRVHGVAVLDPVNPAIKLGERSSQSMFDVPGDKPAPYDFQNVAHGTVHVSYYVSKALSGAPRRVDVYTPPGYESGKGSYPAMYLLHGSGDTELGWTSVGRAHLILDNLIAEGKSKPMIVVMPYGRARADVYLAPFGQPSGDPDAFEKDLLGDVIPLAEKMYRISTKPEDRAIAGLSMGGGQALRIGLRHLDKFHSIGAFSAAARGNPEEQFKEAFADPAATNKKLKTFYIACGKTDSLFAGSKALDEALTAKQIKHTFVASEEGHVWRNWRNYLAEFTPMLFRK